jgi:tetratricopeptide (TPR) repeat protein
LQSLRVGTSEEFRRALGYFQDALDADPSFVAAYARLFEAHLMVVDDDVATMPGTPEQLEKLSEQLTKLAPTNAETHAARAIVFFLNEWKWVEAENEFKQALKADPNCRMALTYYGYFLTRQRRASEARAVLERALASDRISPLISV